MINRLIQVIKSINNTEEKKRLVSNFASLMSLQGVNYILPLLTFPYLVRTLGVENFGLLAFATAFIAYFNIITSYGFDLTATKEISVNRDNHEKLVEIFSSVMTIKFLLLAVSFVVMSIIVFSFDKLSKDWEVYYLSFGVVVGQALFPMWLFQGLERMKYITYVNILAKGIFTVAIFIFVHNQEDYYMVPLLTSIGFIIAGVYSLWLVKNMFGIGLQYQTINTIKFYLYDGWYLFLSRLYVNLYTSTNSVLLGFLTNNTIVGYYSIAEKIIGVVSSLFPIINQVLFPYIVNNKQKSTNIFNKLLKNIVIVEAILSISIFMIVYIFMSDIIKIVAGDFVNEIHYLLKIFIFTIITIPYGSLFSYIFISYDFKKEFHNIMVMTMVLNLILSPIMILLYQAIGLVVVVLIVQIFHVMSFLYYLRRRKFDA